MLCQQIDASLRLPIPHTIELILSEQDVFDTLKYRIEVDRYGTRWYRNAMGQLHRDDGSAVESADGGKFWYQNGLRHRTDGPAVEYVDGSKEWWINSQRMTEDEFNQAVKDYV